MSKIDRIKEEIGWLKVVFVLFVTIDVSFVAWLAQNYDNTPKILVIFGFIGVIALTVMVVWANRATLQRFKALEEE